MILTLIPGAGADKGGAEEATRQAQEEERRQGARGEEGERRQGEDQRGPGDQRPYGWWRQEEGYTGEVE